jgi:hypothetical protein
VNLELPFVGVENYGLLVESLDDLHAEPLLDVPLGLMPFGLDKPTSYSLKVQLGHRYRVVVLNASGRSYSQGRIIVKWGEGTLVDESTQQGDLLVYAIEKSFRIADVEEGASIINTVETAPASAPTSKPSRGNLFGDPIDETTLDSDNLFKVEEPFITIGSGFHTIDPDYISNLGYQNSTIPVEVNITSNSFVMVDAGVTIAPMKGNAMSLNGSAYVLANGGSFIGGTTSAASPTPGYGIYLEGESKIDIMGGVTVRGGDTVSQTQVLGAAVHASGNAEVTIRGGEFHSGSNTIGRNSNNVSIEVVGNATVVIHGGSFFGDWRVREGGSIVVHVCSFILLSDSVMAKLLDWSFLNVQFTSDGQNSITPKYHSQQECAGSATTKQPTAFPTSSPAALPTPRPSSLSPSAQRSAIPTPSPTLQSAVTPSRRPSLSPSISIESSLPPAEVPFTSSPTAKQIWGVSDFAPDDEFSQSDSNRPPPVTTLVPGECMSENTTAVSGLGMVWFCCSKNSECGTYFYFSNSYPQYQRSASTLKRSH